MIENQEHEDSNSGEALKLFNEFAKEISALSPEQLAAVICTVGISEDSIAPDELEFKTLMGGIPENMFYAIMQAIQQMVEKLPNTGFMFIAAIAALIQKNAGSSAPIQHELHALFNKISSSSETLQ